MERADSTSSISTTAPLTWHDFLERMRHPSATDFVKSIKSFIVSFSNNAPDGEKDSAAVQDFLTKMEAAFRVHSLWAGCSEEELESAAEGLEKYVMTKLYPRVFASLPEDVKFDQELSQKMALLQHFIQPENLDIMPAFQNETSWLLAQKELQKINMYKAPRDKLVCILSCCKIINNLLLNASLASNENPPGADEFLPVLIYVTIKANPPQLHSNLVYIQRYRHESRLVSEAAYFFTNMLSAESFISDVDAKSLSMDESEFEKNMEFARTLVSGLSSDPEDQEGYIPRAEGMEGKPHRNDKNFRKEHVAEPASMSDLEKKGARELLSEGQISNKAFEEYPYLYARMDDLTLKDVEDLLNSYKQLVFKYVCLAKGKGVTSQLLPLPAELQTEKHAKAAETSNVKYEDVDESMDRGLLEQLENSEFKMPQHESLSNLETSDVSH